MRRRELSLAVVLVLGGCSPQAPAPAPSRSVSTMPASASASARPSVSPSPSEPTVELSLQRDDDEILRKFDGRGPAVEQALPRLPARYLTCVRCSGSLLKISEVSVSGKKYESEVTCDRVNNRIEVATDDDPAVRFSVHADPATRWAIWYGRPGSH